LPFTSQEDPFNHAPGSQLPNHSNRTQHHFEYDDTLSQDFYDGGRGSHSQPWDWGMEPSRSRPDVYSHSYGYEDNLTGPGRAGRYKSPGPSTSHSQQERQSRPMHHAPGPMSRSQEDYPHSFGPPPPPFDHRQGMMLPPPPHPHGPVRPRMAGGDPLPNHPGLPGPGGHLSHPPGPRMGGPMHPIPPQGPGGMPPFRGPGPLPHHGPRGPIPPPHHSPAMMGPRGPHGPAGPLHGPPPPHHGGPNHGPPWYEAPFDSPRMRGAPPPNHPPHESRFRPVPFGGRSNTPSDAPSPASLPSMSPGPSPHPTPPPTPPPNSLGGPHGPPIPGPPHLHGPPGPSGPPMGMQYMSRPPPIRGPPMWEGPGPRDFVPGAPMQGGRGPPPPNHIPSGPPIYSGGGGPQYPGHIPEWERTTSNW
jgi:hypothetical protein